MTSLKGKMEPSMYKDWSIVDKVQSAVLRFFREVNKPKPGKPKKTQTKELSDPIEKRKTMRLVSA